MNEKLHLLIFRHMSIIFCSIPPMNYWNYFIRMLVFIYIDKCQKWEVLNVSKHCSYAQKIQLHIWVKFIVDIDHKKYLYFHIWFFLRPCAWMLKNCYFNLKSQWSILFSHMLMLNWKICQIHELFLSINSNWVLPKLTREIKKYFFN
jgi:hypothetical protein